jgi:hypothetical protein
MLVYFMYSLGVYSRRDHYMCESVSLIDKHPGAGGVSKCWIWFSDYYWLMPQSRVVKVEDRRITEVEESMLLQYYVVVAINNTLRAWEHSPKSPFT